MRLTTLKTSMPTLSSIGAQRPAIVKHIGTSRRHSMKISAAAASDATEVRPFYRFWNVLICHVQKDAKLKWVFQPHQSATVPMSLATYTTRYSESIHTYITHFRFF